MINLSENRNLENIAEVYKKLVYKYLFEEKTGNYRPYIINSDKSRNYFKTYYEKYFEQQSIRCKIYLSFLKLHFENIILCRFENLNSINKPFTYFYAFDEKERKDISKFAEKLYEDTLDKIGYDILKYLRIRTCPYCNRNYTFAINKNNRKTRPEFDHFYPKSEFPLLALSFYNLIPSCHTCNHLKKEEKIGVNPYKRGFSKATKFEFVDDKGVKINLSSLSTVPDFNIKFESICSDEEKNIKIFALNELYNEHKDYVQEIMDKTQAYNSHARKTLVDSFQGAGNIPEQVYDFVWGRYLDDAEHEKRPLSKLTKDILDHLKITK